MSTTTITTDDVGPATPTDACSCLPGIALHRPSLVRAGSAVAHRAVRAAPQRPYIIYCLREIGTSRHYVGLTARTLPQRVSAHLSQARRDRAVRDGGLMPALRRMLDAGELFEDLWQARVLARAATAEEARRLERQWIATLSAASPAGYNLMPGGSSVGGPDNVVPIMFSLPGGDRRCFPCIGDAVLARNGELAAAGMPLLAPGTVYARLALGWPAAEALDYAPHEDGRGARQPVVFGGKSFQRLRSVSVVADVKVDALRSRLHRRKLAGSAVELGTDMRRTGTGHTPTRSPPLGLRLPGSPQPLTVRAYAERTGLPASTVLHRWHAARRAGLHPARMSAAALLQVLTVANDRRCPVTLRLPDGRRLSGGERELVRQVLEDAALAASRAETLSESGIRRRLRLLSDRDRHDAQKVATAFGFGPIRREG